MFPFSIVYHVSVVKSTLCVNYCCIHTGKVLGILAADCGWHVHGKYRTQAEVDAAFDHIVDTL